MRIKVIAIVSLVMAYVILISTFSGYGFNSFDTSSEKIAHIQNDNQDLRTEANSNEYDEYEKTDDNTGGAVITTRKYRACWYDIPSFFGDIIDQNEYAAWEESYVEKYSNKDPQIMMMLEFIEYFDISREDFDKANLKYAKWISKDRSPLMNPKDYPDQELCEIYDGDLIYSFEVDRINEYYISIVDYPFEYSIEYEQALANGEYTSRTEQWIDVDKMEADIVAKYGEIN